MLKAKLDKVYLYAYINVVTLFFQEDTNNRIGQGYLYLIPEEKKALYRVLRKNSSDSTIIYLIKNPDEQMEEINKEKFLNIIG